MYVCASSCVSVAYAGLEEFQHVAGFHGAHHHMQTDRLGDDPASAANHPGEALAPQVSDIY